MNVASRQRLNDLGTRIELFPVDPVSRGCFESAVCDCDLPWVVHPLKTDGRLGRGGRLRGNRDP